MVFSIYVFLHESYVNVDVLQRLFIARTSWTKYAKDQ